LSLKIGLWPIFLSGKDKTDLLYASRFTALTTGFEPAAFVLLIADLVVMKERKRLCFFRYFNLKDLNTSTFLHRVYCRYQNNISFRKNTDPPNQYPL